MSEKRDVLGPQRFLARFVSGPFNRLKNLTAPVNATRRGTRILLREKGLEPQVNFFSTKIVSFQPRAEQTDATFAYHRVGLKGWAEHPAAERFL